jgi:molybdenum cofactor cytidylyltransferase
VADGTPHCGILLAAGRSTRFGTDKLLHRLPDGTAIALASARAMAAAMPRVVAVVRDDNPALRDLLTGVGIAIVAAPTTDEGMGRSIAAGVAATADAAGWVVGLADMPFIRAATIAKVLAALAAGSPLAAPAIRGQRGHPVGFDRRFRSALAALRGEEGARQLLREHQAQLDLIECADAGIIADIDRPGDLGQDRGVA